MKRRIFSVLTALALCLGLLPVLALAAEGTGTADNPWKCGNNVTVTLVDGVLTFEGEGDMTNELTLSSDRPWRAERGSITSAVIGSGITSIGKSILEDLNKLTSVQIASTVTSIGDRAFYGCEVLSTVKLPSNLTSIGTYAFSYCRGLASIEIPSGVKTLGDNAFSSTGLTEVTIPDGVTSIGKNAFANCASLTTVEIPASVTTIGEGALGGKTNAEIHYPGTTDQWNTITGGKSGAQTDKVHTSDSDVTYQVTIMGGEEGAFGTGTYKAKETVKVFAGMKDKFAFAGWTVSPEGTDLGTDFDPSKAETSLVMPAENVTLTASWAEAVVIASGVYFADLQAAFDYAANDEYSHAVTLLKDVTVDQPITLSKGTVTLSSREKNTLTGTGSATISVTGGSLTLEDVTVENTSEGQVLAPGAVIPGTAINVSGSGNLTVSDGSAVRAEGKDGWALFYSGGQAHITIQGGTISGGEGFGFNTTGGFTADKISLLGGTFIGRTGSAVRVPSGFMLWNLVGEGLALFNDDTKELVDLTEEFTGPGTFTVSCAHYSVESESVKASDPDENGVVTVTATCDKCKETVTLGTLTMVGSGQTITYGDQEPTLEVQAKGLIVTGYEWSGSGVPSDNTNSTITPAALGTGEFNYTCAVTFTVPGGTGSANLKFTLKVEPLDISTVEWTVRIDPEKVTYNGQPQKLKSIVVSNDSMSLGEDQFDIQFVDASGNEAAEQTDAGTYKIKLTGKVVLKGTITLDDPLFVIEPATSTIGWPEGTAEEKLTYTGEAAELKTTPKVTVTGMDSYVGDPVTYSYAAAEAGPYTPGLPTDAGTYYVKAAVPQQKNYTAAETEKALTLVIGKAETKITVEPKAASLTYNGAAQALVTAAEASVGEVQYALSADGTWSKEIPTATVPGTYEVYYKVPETANYTGVAVQGPVNVEIKKAEVVAASQNLLVKNKLAKTYTLDLKPFLPVLPQGQTYGKLIYELTETDIRTEGYIVAGTVKLNGTVLTVPVNAVEDSKVGAVADITLTIKSDNFKDIQQIVTVSSTNKTPVIITGVTAAGWTYDGKVHPGCTGTPDTGEYTGELEALYGTWPFTDWLDGAPKDAGTYQVHLSIPEEGTEYEGEIILFFTVEQAQVTIKADDKTANVGDPEPELTYQVSGRAEGEALKTEPKLTCTPDMNAEGTYPIEISGAAVPDGGNYKAEIVYQPGTLTVSEKPAPPKPVDPTPPVDPDDLEVKLEVKEGFTEVPPALRTLEHLNTPEKLTQVMRTKITQTGVPAGNTAVYDVKLMVSADGGRTWAPATAANFPSGGLTVTLPYPEGTDSGYVFTVVHMFTTSAFGKTPGDTESPTVTNTEQGLRFTVTGLSPISVGWRAKTTGGSSGGSSGSYSGGGGSRPTASVTVEETEHGKVTSDRSSAGSGSPVTLTVQPDKGYRLESLTVTDSRGNKLRLTAQGGGKYAFTMSAGAVTVKAVFAPLAEDADCPSRAFADLESGAWYHEAVDFVLRNGLMNGYGDHSFKPDRTLTRAQFAQILYNKEGRPAAAGGAPFTDVPDGAWCAPAIAWAAERGIAGGYGGGLFGPDDAITREQLAVMLWRYAGSPAAPDGGLAFVDAEQIGTHAREALGWATRTGVMNGKGGGVLDPKGPATRAQTAQMLKNFLENG